MNYQRQFLQTLEEKLGGRNRMVPALMTTLKLGKDAVYRRLRGTTTMTAEELIELVNAYGVPLPVAAEGTSGAAVEALTGQGADAPQQYFAFAQERQLERLEQQNNTMLRITSELPLEYELALPTMRALKLYIYGISTWQVPQWQAADFSLRLIHPAITEAAEQYVQLAFRFSGEQLLSPNMFDITINQLQYLADVGRLKDTRIGDIAFDEMLAIANHLEKMALRESQFLPGQENAPSLPVFRSYVNEMATASSMNIMLSDESRILINTTIKPQFTISFDQDAIQQSTEWYASLREKATLLGTGNRTFTSAFFTKLRRRVQAGRQQFRDGFDAAF